MATKSAEQQDGSEPGTQLAEIFAETADLRALIVLTPHCLDQFRRGKRIGREAAEQELFNLMIAEGTFMSAAPGWLRSPVFTSVGYIMLGDDRAIRLEPALEQGVSFVATSSFRRTDWV